MRNFKDSAASLRGLPHIAHLWPHIAHLQVKMWVSSIFLRPFLSTGTFPCFRHSPSLLDQPAPIVHDLKR
jgi:hypothetical protein